VVEAVERIDPELRQNRLMDREILLQRQIAVKVPRSKVAVCPSVADLIQSRLREAAGRCGLKEGARMRDLD
jgi:hypothetical protein